MNRRKLDNAGGTRAALTSIMFIALASLSPTAHAQESQAAEFFRGKNISVVVAGGPAGGQAQYVNMIAPYLTKHIPGHPAIVTRLMPGGGGMIASNFLYNLSPHDGTELGALLASQPISEKLGRPGVRYASAKYTWIGRFASTNGVIVAHKNAKAKTIEEAKTTEIVIGAPGVEQLPALSNWALGTKFKIIRGYRGLQDSVLAYERGEIDGFYSSWTGLKSSFQRHMNDNIFMQSALESEPEYAHIPLLTDLVTDPRKKAVTTFFASEYTIGRFLVAPPNLPADRSAVLRKAFDDAIADPEFRTRAVALDIEPRTGAALQEIVARVLDTPADIIETAKQATDIEAEGGRE